MTPERFGQLEELYHAVRDRTAEERSAFLAQTDPELRLELESLLAHSIEGNFLDRPAIENSVLSLNEFSSAVLVTGACLGPYRIEGSLGEGGMGRVFRAMDTRLNRAVAIKVLKEQFSARFEREARAISALNHPNICTLYDIGPSYLVMELIEGETIAARLTRNAFPLKEAVRYAVQILDALIEAHGKGVVHRDLKPSNIMIAKSGIKVLDFGLAKSRQDDSLMGGHIVLGTPAYMASEQREGKPADARSDIYSFGCVLSEMLTGTRSGPWPRHLVSRKSKKIIDRCLQQDPGRRWQSAAKLRDELARLQTPIRWTRISAAAAAATLALFTAAMLFHFRGAPKLTPADTLVLTKFENKTGDPVFDQTLRRGLAVELEQSPFLRLVSDDSIKHALHLMNRPAETPLTSDIAREICERTASTAVLEGSIEGLGSRYVLWLRARNCNTGAVLAQAQALAGGKDEVLNTLSRIAVQIRTRLGESLATVREHATPLEQATTSSLDALKAYTAGSITLHSRGGPAAIPQFLHAIALDPQFAMAYGDLSIVYWNMGQTDISAEYTRKAYALRDRVSDRERLWILFLYDRQVTGNLPRELETLESWARTYPHDFLPFAVLGGWGTMGTGQYERGLLAAQEALRLNPDSAYAYGSSQHYYLLDRFAESENVLRRAEERKLEIPEYLILRYYLAFFKGDHAGMEREIARAPGEHAEDWISHNEALVFAYSGEMREARSMWDRAVALAQQAGNSEAAARYRAAEGVCEAQFGNAPAAKERARAALKLANDRDVAYASALALALAGDSAGSQRLAGDLDRRFPEDTPVQFEYLPILRATFALAHQRPSAAVEHLQRSLPYDFALPGTAFFAKFGGLYPPYVRGRAFLELHKGREAVVEFEKILNHRGIVSADPIGSLAHLQLGRAYVVSGEKARARNAYRDFLALWKNADAELPVLRQARAEYAALIR